MIKRLIGLALPVILIIVAALKIKSAGRVFYPVQHLEQHKRLVDRYNFKRLVDIVASLIGIAVLWPVFLIIAAAVKINSEGSVFYLAKRVGQNGQLFHLYKFRSMVTNADKIGPAVTGAADSRITSVGRFLRRTKLDELPQLYNVLRGDMSLVGPRPEAPHYVEMYTPEQREVLNVRPGITSLASIAYRHESDMLVGDAWEQDYITKVMPAKISIDLEYVKHPTVSTDFRVLAQTVVALFR